MDRKNAGAKCPVSEFDLLNRMSGPQRGPDMIGACLFLAAVGGATAVAAVRRADAVAAGLVTLALAAGSATIRSGFGL